MRFDQQMDVRSVVLDERVRLQINRMFGEVDDALLGSMEFRERRRDEMRAMVVELYAELRGRAIEIEEEESIEFVPADWWQAFKQRWFRRWSKPKMRRIVKRHVYKTVHVCPHIKHPPGRDPHITFLTEDFQL